MEIQSGFVVSFPVQIQRGTSNQLLRRCEESSLTGPSKRQRQQPTSIKSCCRGRSAASLLLAVATN